MLDDPIVEEVRKARMEHAERFGFDLKAIYEDLKRKERANNRKVVKFKPRLVAIVCGREEKSD